MHWKQRALVLLWEHVPLCFATELRSGGGGALPRSPHTKVRGEMAKLKGLPTLQPRKITTPFLHLRSVLLGRGKLKQGERGEHRSTSPRPAGVGEEAAPSGHLDPQLPSSALAPG